MRSITRPSGRSFGRENWRVKKKNKKKGKKKNGIIKQRNERKEKKISLGFALYSEGTAPPPTILQKKFKKCKKIQDFQYLRYEKKNVFEVFFLLTQFLREFDFLLFFFWFLVGMDLLGST